MTVLLTYLTMTVGVIFGTVIAAPFWAACTVAIIYSYPHLKRLRVVLKDGQMKRQITGKDVAEYSKPDKAALGFLIIGGVVALIGSLACAGFVMVLGWAGG